MAEENEVFRALLFEEEEKNTNYNSLIESKKDLEKIGPTYERALIRSVDSPIIEKGENIGIVIDSSYIEGEGIVAVCLIQDEEYSDKLLNDDIRLYGSVQTKPKKCGWYVYVHTDDTEHSQPAERIEIEE